MLYRWKSQRAESVYKSGVEDDGDDQPNNYTHFLHVIHTHNVWHLGQTKVSCLWRQNAVTFMYVCMYVAMNSGSIQEFRGSKMMFDSD